MMDLTHARDFVRTTTEVFSDGESCDVVTTMSFVLNGGIADYRVYVETCECHLSVEVTDADGPDGAPAGVFTCDEFDGHDHEIVAAVAYAMTELMMFMSVEALTP